MALSRECLLEIIAAEGDVRKVVAAFEPEIRAVGGAAYLDAFEACIVKNWSVADLTKLADSIHIGLTRQPAAASVSGYINPRVRAQVIERDGYVCTYCECDVTIPHLDHVVPHSRGGPSTPDNLVVSCQSCNASKRDRPLSEWRRR